jgi:hypothetical protein
MVRQTPRHSPSLPELVARAGRERELRDRAWQEVLRLAAMDPDTEGA